MIDDPKMRYGCLLGDNAPPVETTQATAKAIVQTLKRKNIAAIMVEV